MTDGLAVLTGDRDAEPGGGVGCGGSEQLASQRSIDGPEPGDGAGLIAVPGTGVQGDGQGDPAGDRRARVRPLTLVRGWRRGLLAGTAGTVVTAGRAGARRGCGGGVAAEEGIEVGAGAHFFQCAGQAYVAEGQGVVGEALVGGQHISGRQGCSQPTPRCQPLHASVAPGGLSALPHWRRAAASGSTERMALARAARSWPVVCPVAFGKIRASTRPVSSSLRMRVVSAISRARA